MATPPPKDVGFGRPAHDRRCLDAASAGDKGGRPAAAFLGADAVRVAAKDDRGASRAGLRPAHPEPARSQAPGAMRWVAAHANTCKYAEAYAAFDARRAGLDDAAIEALRNGDHTRWSDAERAALEFARKMTIESTKVSDAEFAALAKSFGEKKAAAMVLLIGLRQLPGPLADLPGGTGRGRRTADAGRGRIYSRGLVGAQEPRRPSRDPSVAQADRQRPHRGRPRMGEPNLRRTPVKTGKPTQPLDATARAELGRAQVARG